jgi:hypothetical protein
LITSLHRNVILPIFIHVLILLIYGQVSEQVLNEQVKCHILRLCENLVETADRFQLASHHALNHLNGDLRALLLVINSIPGK